MNQRLQKIWNISRLKLLNFNSFKTHENFDKNFWKFFDVRFNLYRNLPRYLELMKICTYNFIKNFTNITRFYMSQVQVDKIDYRGKYLMKYLQRSFRNPALPKFVHLCPFLKPLNAFFRKVKSDHNLMRFVSRLQKCSDQSK